jgi:hypothetical protein
MFIYSQHPFFISYTRLIYYQRIIKQKFWV